MPRLSRLQRSNNAHFDLRVKAGNLPGKRGDVVYEYHGKMISLQSKANRVFSRKERRDVFSRIEKQMNGRR